MAIKVGVDRILEKSISMIEPNTQLHRTPFVLVNTANNSEAETETK